MLDLRATGHFSRIRTDFKNLKHWYNPKTIYIINRQQVKSIRYRLIYLDITSKKAKFNNV